MKVADGAALAVIVIGLLCTVIGAWRASAAVIIDEKTADILAGTYWDKNEPLKKALMDQSAAARQGLILIAIGTSLQIIGVLAQAAIVASK